MNHDFLLLVRLLSPSYVYRELLRGIIGFQTYRFKRQSSFDLESVVRLNLTEIYLKKRKIYTVVII